MKAGAQGSPAPGIISRRRFTELLLNCLGPVAVLLEHRLGLFDELLQLLVVGLPVRLFRKIEHSLVHGDFLVDVSPVELGTLRRGLESSHFTFGRRLYRVVGRRLGSDVELLGQLLALKAQGMMLGRHQFRKGPNLGVRRFAECVRSGTTICGVRLVEQRYDVGVAEPLGRRGRSRSGISSCPRFRLSCRERGPPCRKKALAEPEEPRTTREVIWPPS